MVGASVVAFATAPSSLEGLWKVAAVTATGIVAGYGAKWCGALGYIGGSLLGHGVGVVAALTCASIGCAKTYDTVNAQINALALRQQTQYATTAAPARPALPAVVDPSTVAPK
jgi:hypothetical protein